MKKNNASKINHKSFLPLLSAFIFIIITGTLSLLSLTTNYENNMSYAQQMSSTTSPANTTTNQPKHLSHELDDLIVAEHIPLSGQLESKDYLLLLDLTPFTTSVEGHSHIALKVQCDDNGNPQGTIVTGIAPNLKALDIGKPIENGTLDGKPVSLSKEGKSCLYHGELPQTITHIMLINTSNQTLNFDNWSYSIAVAVHGTAIEHK